MIDGDNDSRRRKLLDAARALFLQQQYDLLAGLTLESVALKAGVPVRSANREFSADELRHALIEDLLRVRPSEDLDQADFIEFTGRLTNRERPLADEIGDIFTDIVDHNRNSELFRSLMAFWAFSEHDPHVRSKISTMYHQWLRDARDGLNAMFIQQLDAIPLRTDWISVDDFVRATHALAEGLVMQIDVHEHDPKETGDVDLRAGITPMDPDLPRKLILTILASMIEAPEVPSIEEIFQGIEKRRVT